MASLSSHAIPFARLSFVVLTLCILRSEFFAQDFKAVHDGIEYAEVTRQLADKEPVKINLLRLDLKKVRLDVHHAFDKAIGLEATSSIATRHGAVAAINAGFFRLDKSPFAGDAASTLMINGELLSEGDRDRIALIIPNRRGMRMIFIERFNSSIWLGVEHREIPGWLSGVNRERKKGEIILYGPAFSETTLTEPGGTEVILTGCKRVYKKFEIVKELAVVCNHIVFKKNSGNNVIPTDGYVLSIAPEEWEKKTLIVNALEAITKNDKQTKVYFRTDGGYGGTVIPTDVNDDIIAGVPQLIKNGKIDITWEQEKASKSFVETRHPRTAVAKLKDGKFLMMTVDGRQQGTSVGMNLYELAEYLLSLGAVDAMNLDGGGSTTMFLDGKVVNKPSDKEGERKVGDAILVTLRTKKPQPPKKQKIEK